MLHSIILLIDLVFLFQQSSLMHFYTISHSHADPSISHALALSWYQIFKLFLYLHLTLANIGTFMKLVHLQQSFKYLKFFRKQSPQFDTKQ